MPQWNRLDACERSFRRRLGGAENRAEAEPLRALRHREHSPDWPQASVEAELPDHRVPP